MAFLSSCITKLSGIFEKICVIAIMICVAALSVDLALAVISRYVFKLPIVWADELAVLLLAWITFLGASLSIKRNEMIAVTVLLDKLKGKSLIFVQIFIQLLILSVTILFLYYGTRWALSSNSIRTSLATMPISAAIPYMIFPITMLFISVFCLSNILNIVTNHKKVKVIALEQNVKL